jgi:hypothetical protein
MARIATEIETGNLDRALQDWLRDHSHQEGREK